MGRTAGNWTAVATGLSLAAGLACGLARAEDTAALPTWTPPKPAECQNPPKDAILLTLARCCVTDPHDVDKGQGCVKAVGKPDFYSILRDSDASKKGADLLVPTDAVTGVEDPHVQEKPWSDDFDFAWAFAEPKRGRKTILAVNSVAARKDGQLHVHIGCVKADILPELAKAGIHTGATQVTIDKHTYTAVWVQNLSGDNSPFKVVEKRVGAKDMQYQGIAVVGAVKESGGKVVDDTGYFILDTAGKTKAEGGYAEALIDYTICQ